MKQRRVPHVVISAALALGATAANAGVGLSFEGTSQYDNAALGRNFIPPDTMGAIGTTQYMEFSNGSVAVFDKATGVLQSRVSDTSFWATAGQTVGSPNGDQRVMFDKFSSRWIAVGFGASVSDLQIAVSDSPDAGLGWKSVKFTGFAGGTADYPTLALDANGVYIGTHNFSATSVFQGTSLFVIPRADLVDGTPDVARMSTFTSSAADPNQRGYSIQGVNSRSAGSGAPGRIQSVDNDNFAFDRYDVNNIVSAGAATLTASQEVSVDPYVGNNSARQPNTLNPKVVATLDDRLSSSVWEVNGKIYSVHTVGLDMGTSTTADDHTAVRYTVIDAATNAILDTGDISGGGDFDYYQGSLAVNSDGQVVIGYNRSGGIGEGTAGRISFFARTYHSVLDELVLDDEYLLKQSLVDDYHNGSVEGLAAVGRQRWGDYSAVSLDPNDEHSFWAIGQFAREYNTPANGHVGGTGGSRWGTWISEIEVADLQAASVPEAKTNGAIMFGLVAAAVVARRQSRKA